MADEAPPFVLFSTVSGEPIILNPLALPEDSVFDIRRRVGAALGVHMKKVVFLHGHCELANGATMGTVLSESSVPAMVTVISQPCHIRAEDYESYIDRVSAGVLEVDRIKVGCGYPADAGERRGMGCGHLSKDPDRIKSYEMRHRIPAVIFPPPQDININMMPFIMGDSKSLPEAYQQYWPLIEACLKTMSHKERGMVGYLTIHESLVKQGQSQRRAGLHVETPGKLYVNGSFREERYFWGPGCAADGGIMVREDWSQVKGGIYMASNVANSCKVWDVQIWDPASVAGKLGDLEHLRDLLGEGTCMKAEKLYWITDVTPHESLPMAEDTYRQYFRLVTSSLSAWYPENATPNPLGIQPDPAITWTIPGNKFTSQES